MKNVNYFEQIYTVPVYAKFIATDANGETWWFTVKPNDAHSMWIVGKGGNCGRCGNNTNVKYWRRSLRGC